MVHGGVDSPPLSEKDGAPRWGLPPSYNNFNLPTPLLPQAPIIWKAPYIVSFYPQYIINVFSSLTSPLAPQKNPFERVPSPGMTHNYTNLKEPYNKGSKYKVQVTTEIIKKRDGL